MSLTSQVPLPSQDWMDARQMSRRVYEWETSTRKPDWMTPTQVAIISLLIWASADTHEASFSHGTLAAMCACSYDTMERALKPLVKQGWVTSRRVKGLCRMSLTDAYLSHLAIKLEVTPDAEAFTKWYQELQKSQPAGVVSEYGRKQMDPKNDARHHHNAAEIIQRCGSVERAKAATNFVVKFKKKAIQTIYDLRLIVNQPSFMEEWKAFEKDGTTPAPSLAIPRETDSVKFERLIRERQQASARWNMNRSDKLLEAAADAANDAAAQQAMKMGVSPDEFAIKGIWMPNKYREIWKEEYGGGGKL